MKKREEIRIRDPFILTDRENGCYYMYGTTTLLPHSYRTEPRLLVYRSTDLETFDDGTVIFDGAACGFWATEDYWAPEVHVYRGAYYLFCSFKSSDRRRGTQILRADTPIGPFQPISQGPITPPEWEALDGTLYVEDGIPYMVFCHEWVQVGDGEICAVRLSEDLSHPVGEPVLLFRASENPNVTPIRAEKGKYVTDGPFLWSEDGRVHMIWSSLYNGRYLVLEAESDRLLSPWRHFCSRYDFDGGHAMLFRDLEGRRMISLHSPNRTDFERAAFMEYGR